MRTAGGFLSTFLACLYQRFCQLRNGKIGDAEVQRCRPRGLLVSAAQLALALGLDSVVQGLLDQPQPRLGAS